MLQLFRVMRISEANIHVQETIFIDEKVGK